VSDGHAGDQSSKRFLPPPLEGVHAHLRPVTPRDYELIQALELSTELAFRWRFRGSTPSPEQWAQTLWRGVIAQYLVVSPGQQQPIGLVLAYNANFQDQYAYVAVARFESQTRSPVMILGFGIFIHYVFTCWPFRKLYLESSQYNYDQFASGMGRYFEVEARLRDHSFFGGQYWDQLTLAIYREPWMRLGKRLLAVESPAGAGRARVHAQTRTHRNA
jgi:hypothetical protein